MEAPSLASNVHDISGAKAPEGPPQETDISGNPLQRVVVMSTHFTIPTRYQVVRGIGRGAYGTVCAAIDHRTGEHVAIKKVSEAFEHLIDSKRTLREIILLRQFDHENVMKLHGLLAPTGELSKFEDVYLVTELMDTDLNAILRSSQNLEDQHCQYFLYQILRGLKYLHSANVLHRDLKPSNILLSRNCDLKICDFGLARFMGQADESNAFVTEYVATRWYRAPEVILSWTEYAQAMDIWSVGCIFAEILLREPLFPGRDYLHQLRLIIAKNGKPSNEELSNINNDRARNFIHNLPDSDGSAFEKLFEGVNTQGVDLLKRMLTFDPHERITCQEALSHNYILYLHDTADEPAFPEEGLMNFEFESRPEELTTDVVRGLIYDLATTYQP